MTELIQNGVGLFISRIMQAEGFDHNKINNYISRLTAIENIKQIDLHVEEVAGEDKTITWLRTSLTGSTEVAQRSPRATLPSPKSARSGRRPTGR